MTLKEELVELVRAKSIGSVWRSVDDVVDEVASFIERREEAERERVKAVVRDKPRSGWQVEFLIAQLYPPKVEMLPAGMYAVRSSGGTIWLFSSDVPFRSDENTEYRSIKNPFEE